MDTKLISGAAIPDFDKDIAAWLNKARCHPDDEPVVVRIGIRNKERRIYRHITVRWKHQHLDTIAFFDKAGFSELPVDFAGETGLDYVFHHDEW